MNEEEKEWTNDWMKEWIDEWKKYYENREIVCLILFVYCFVLIFGEGI